MEHPHVQGLSDWRLLSRGSSSVVWEARQTSLERLVAVKVYERELGEDDRRRFLHEAAAVGRLSGHPGIVTSHDAGVLADDRPFLVVELYPGGSLAGWLEPGKRPSEQQVRRVGVQIADALAAAHECGLLHGDVKPAKILIDEYGSPRLADFGLAAVEGIDPARGPQVRLTSAYAPPEVLQGQPASEAGDVFSLAATLYALLAGRPPRTVAAGVAGPDQEVELSSGPIAPLPAVNWFLMGVLTSALSEDPAERPTARSFRDQLASVTLEAPSSGARRRFGARTAWFGPSAGPGAAGRDPAAQLGHPGAPSTALFTPRRASGEAVRGAPPRPQGYRRDAILTLAVVVIALLGAASIWLIDTSAPSGALPAPSQTSTSPRPSAGASEGSAGAGSIELQPSTTTAKPFQAVRIEGWHSGRARTFLRVQRWERGSWRAFPLPTRTDESGNFTAHVEFGQPGRYQVRVVNPDSGAASEPIELRIVEA